MCCKFASRTTIITASAHQPIHSHPRRPLCSHRRERQHLLRRGARKWRATASRRAIRTWRHRTQLAHAFQAMCDRSDRLHDRQLQRSMLRSWRRRVVQNTQERLDAARVLHRRLRARRCFRTWARNAHDAAALRAAVAQLGENRNSRLRRRGLRTWRQWTATRLASRATVERVMRRWRMATEARAFGAFVHNVEERRYARHIMARAVGHHDTVLLRFVWRGWHSFVVHYRRARAELKRQGDEHYRTASMRRGVDRWRAHTRRMQVAKGAWLLAMGHSRRRVLRQCMAAWQLRVEWWMEKRFKLEAAEKHWRTRKRRKALALWNERTDELAEARWQAQQSLLHLLTSTRRRYFTKWSAYVRAQVAGRQAWHSALMMHKKHTFAKWRNVTVVFKRAREWLQAAVRMNDKHLKTSALRGWRRYTDASKRIKAHTAMAISHNRRATLLWALRSWSGTAREQREEQWALQHWVRKTLTTALGVWAANAHASARDKAGEEAASSFNRTRIMRHAFGMWYSSARLKKVLKVVAWRFQDNRRRDTFMRWRAWTVCVLRGVLFDLQPLVS